MTRKGRWKRDSNEGGSFFETREVSSAKFFLDFFEGRMAENLDASRRRNAKSSCKNTSSDNEASRMLDGR